MLSPLPPKQDKTPTTTDTPVSFEGALFDQIAATGVAFPIRRDVIRASGADAASYLQGQLSQDVVGLAVGSSAWTLLLQPQGKLTALLLVTRTGEKEFVLTTDVGAGEAAVARLQRFRLRVECELVLTTEPGIAVRGAVAPPTEVPADVVVAQFQWAGVTGFDLIGEAATTPEGVVNLSPEAGDALRITIGLPQMGTELDEKTIPAEAGIVNMSASFTKGCYVGQELVARIDSRANNTPRRLARLAADSNPDAGTELLLDGVVVGRLTSVVANEAGGSVALGYLARKAGDATEFDLAGTAGSVRLLSLV